MKNKPINLKYDKEVFKKGETKVLYDNVGEGEKNLFVVTIPSQLISAIEAQKYFSTKNNVLVILFFVVGNGDNINQLFELSSLFPYDKLITYQQKDTYNLISFKKYLNCINKYTYNYNFYGHVNLAYRKQFANIKYNHLYLLDDGTYSLSVHNLLTQQSKEENKYIGLDENLNFKKRLINMIYNFMGIKRNTHLNNLNFFTIFNIKDYNTIITHDYSHVKSLFSSHKIKDNKIYILGQPFRKIMKMSTFEYIQAMKEVLDCYPNHQFVYIPHRQEYFSDVFSIFLLQQKNLTVKKLNIAIEIYFLQKGIVPHQVFSFTSTALFVLKKIFPKTKIQYIEIDTTFLSAFHQENIQLIYENYKKDGIKKFNCQK